MKDFNDYIEKLSTLISYESKLEKGEKNSPFGRETAKALNFCLSLAESFGFETKNYDNYAGEVIFGIGEEIGIMGHLDVVPEGEGWQTPPYTLTEKNGVYFGRGVVDDKGPILLCLYALKELKESGVKVNKKFRLIFGTNEETGWKDVDYLKKNTVMPEYGFSPDGDFPLSYAEKGVNIIKFTIPKFKNFRGVKGGSVINAVCSEASVIPLKSVNGEKLKKYNLEFKDGKIYSYGKTAHGAHPEQGVNALDNLFKFLLAEGEDVQQVLDYIINDKSKLREMENGQGHVTMSPDLISETENGVVISCDNRYPYPVAVEKIKEKLDSFNIPYELSEKHDAVCCDKNGNFVQTLKSAYESVMNKKILPLSLCGSTFARAFNKGVAFGPEFPNSNNKIHEPDENVSKEELLLSYEIYKKAIFDLAK